MFKPSRRTTIECWTWYSICICAVTLRLISRRIPGGHSHFRRVFIDDWIIGFALCTYTIAITGLFTYEGTSLGLDYDTLSTQQASYYGKRLGIINILTETSIQTTIWLVKASLLVFYYDLTDRIRWNTAILAVGIYIALAYVAVIVALYGGWCRPFSEYLVLHPYVVECVTWHHYNILQLILNVSTDLLILIIPMTVLAKTSLELRRKILVACLFGLGIFVILSAILQKVSVFLDPTGPVWILWSTREVSTAMIVGNLIVCVPLMRKVSKFLGQNIFSSPRGTMRSSLSTSQGASV